MYIHNERGCPTDGDKTHSTISKNSVDFAHQALTLSLGLILFKRDPDQRVCNFFTVWHDRNKPKFTHQGSSPARQCRPEINKLNPARYSDILLPTFFLRRQPIKNKIPINNAGPAIAKELISIHQLDSSKLPT